MFKNVITHDDRKNIEIPPQEGRSQHTWHREMCCWTSSLSETCNVGCKSDLHVQHCILFTYWLGKLYYDWKEDFFFKCNLINIVGRWYIQELISVIFSISKLSVIFFISRFYAKPYIYTCLPWNIKLIYVSWNDTNSLKY